MLTRARGRLRRRTTDFLAGDAVVLRTDLVHQSATNVTSELRLSCDTRWQPAHEPRDDRVKVWHGACGAAAGAAGGGGAQQRAS